MLPEINCCSMSSTSKNLVDFQAKIEFQTLQFFWLVLE